MESMEVYGPNDICYIMMDVLEIFFFKHHFRWGPHEKSQIPPRNSSLFPCLFSWWVSLVTLCMFLGGFKTSQNFPVILKRPEVTGSFEHLNFLIRTWEWTEGSHQKFLKASKLSPRHRANGHRTGSPIKAAPGSFEFQLFSELLVVFGWWLTILGIPGIQKKGHYLEICLTDMGGTPPQICRDKQSSSHSVGRYLKVNTRKKVEEALKWAQWPDEVGPKLLQKEFGAPDFFGSKWNKLEHSGSFWTINWRWHEGPFLAMQVDFFNQSCWMLVEKTTFNPLDSLDERCFKTKRNNSNKKYINEEILILKCLASAFSILVLVGFFPLTQSNYDSEEIRFHNEYMVVILQNDVSTHIGPLGVHLGRYYFDKLPYSRISHQHINSNIMYLCYPKFENEKNIHIQYTLLMFELDDILLFPLHLSRIRYLNSRGLVSVLPEKKTRGKRKNTCQRRELPRHRGVLAPKLMDQPWLLQVEIVIKSPIILLMIYKLYWHPHKRRSWLGSSSHGRRRLHLLAGDIYKSAQISSQTKRSPRLPNGWRARNSPFLETRVPKTAGDLKNMNPAPKSWSVLVTKFSFWPTSVHFFQELYPYAHIITSRHLGLVVEYS